MNEVDAALVVLRAIKRIPDLETEIEELKQKIGELESEIELMKEERAGADI